MTEANICMGERQVETESTREGYSLSQNLIHAGQHEVRRKAGIFPQMLDELPALLDDGQIRTQGGIVNLVEAHAPQSRYYEPHGVDALWKAQKRPYGHPHGRGYLDACLD